MENFGRLFDEYTSNNPTAWQDWKDEKSQAYRKWIRRRVRNLLEDIRKGKFYHHGSNEVVEKIKVRKTMTPETNTQYQEIIQIDYKLIAAQSDSALFEEDALTPLNTEWMLYIWRTAFSKEEDTQMERINLIVPGNPLTRDGESKKWGTIIKHKEYIQSPRRALSNPRIPLLLIWYRHVLAFSILTEEWKDWDKMILGIYILNDKEALQKFLDHWSQSDVWDKLLHRRISIHIQRLLANNQ